ncbi:MAG: hypothetical protein ABI843_15245 [Dokdonella sp.]
MSTSASRGRARAWSKDLSLATALAVTTFLSTTGSASPVAPNRWSPDAIAGGTNGIIHSSPLNHTIAATTFGTSLNIVSSALDDSGPIDGDWDVNFWASGSNNDFTFWGVSTYTAEFVVDGSGNGVVLQAGDVVGPSSTFSTTGGTLLASPAWLAGTDGYAGVRFNCDGRLTFPVATTVCYGAVHVTTTATTGFPATIVDTAFDGDGAAFTIGGGGSGPPTVTKAFAPTSVAPGAVSTLTITLANSNATAATLSTDLTDSFPGGMAAATPLNFSTDCPNGAAVAFPGSSSVTLIGGSQIPASGSCTITIDVVAASAGSYSNTIAAGALQTDQGSSPADASATLTVGSTGSPPTVTKAFAPTSVAPGVVSTLTITLTNSNVTAATLSADLTDGFPAGLAVATPLAFGTDCPNGAAITFPGSSSVTLISGSQIPASGSCTITIAVSAATAGSYVNTIAAGALQTDLGNSAADANATLMVGPIACDGGADEIFCDGFDGSGAALPVQPIVDPSFETTSADAQLKWEGSDSHGDSGAMPFHAASPGHAHSGIWSARGGGWHTGKGGVQTWSQSVTISSGGPRYLNYWRFVAAAPDAPGTLTIWVDGTPVATADVAANGVDVDWTRVSVDLSAYADDATHLLEFNYTTSSDDGEFFIDDVTIDDQEGSKSSMTR